MSERLSEHPVNAAVIFSGHTHAEGGRFRVVGVAELDRDRPVLNFDDAGTGQRVQVEFLTEKDFALFAAAVAARYSLFRRTA